MQLPKTLTKPTLLSKILAMVLFIALPFIGFLFGMKYQQLLDLKSELLSIKSKPLTNQSHLPTSAATFQSDTSNWESYTNKEYGFSFKYPFGFSYLEPYDFANIKQYFEKNGVSLNGINAFFYKSVENKNIVEKKCAGQPIAPGYIECFDYLMVFNINIKEYDWVFNEFTDTKKRNLDRVIAASGWGSDKSVYLPGTVSSYQAKIYKKQNGDISAFVDYSDEKYIEISIIGYDSSHGFKDSQLVLNSIKL